MGTAFANPSPTQEISNLELSYQREYLFLNAQKRELQKTLNEIQSNYSKLEKKLEQEHKQREAKLLKLTSENEKLELSVSELETQVSAIADARSILDSTVEQAATNLLVEFSQDLQTVEKRNLVFNKAQAALSHSLMVTKEEGSFFDLKGVKVNGQILSLGRIAKFGVHKDMAGALAPVGNGEWKLVPEGSETADQLAQNLLPTSIEAFIYEDAGRAITQKEEKNIVEFITSGGSVAWVIVILGFVTLVLIIYRALNLRTLENVGIPERALTDDDLRVINSKTKSSGAKFLQMISPKLHAEDSLLEKILEEAFVVIGSRLDRFGGMILVLASVAPLLGLLGTVTGMISTFDIITQFGTGDPKLLSSGISEALITTELGLVVAIPALFFGNLLTAQSRKIKNQLEQIAYLVLQRKKNEESNEVQA